MAKISARQALAMLDRTRACGQTDFVMGHCCGLNCPDAMRVACRLTSSPSG
jgi:hypothetical protein